MKKCIKGYPLLILLAIALFSCNNDDDLSFPTLEETVNVTNNDLTNFLENFTINDKEIFTNGELNSDVVESDVRFINLASDSLSDDIDNITSKIKLSELLQENRPLGLPQLKAESIQITNSTSQTYYYMILREGVADGKKVYRRDPSLLRFQAPSIFLSPTDSDGLIDISEATKDEIFWISRTTGGFEAFDRVRSRMRAGVIEGTCFTESFNIDSNSGIAIMIVPGTLTVDQPSSSNSNSFAYVFTVLNTQRTDADGDGILSIDEDLDGNGDVTNDDSDNDGTPNYLDLDDDGDGKRTALELKEGELIDLNEEDDENCNNITNDDFRLNVGDNPDFLNKDVN